MALRWGMQLTLEERQALEKWMAAKRLTTRAVASLLGCSQSSVSKWRTSGGIARTVHAKLVEQISDYMMSDMAKALGAVTGQPFIEVKPGRMDSVHSIRDLLEEIRQRPALWLGTKSLTGLKCLLNGYEMACYKHAIRKTAQLPDDVPWQGFNEWLKLRYGKVNWSVDWHWLLVEMSKSEEEAFDRFFELLTEYEKSYDTII